jgi:hypothetical protein
MSILNIFTPENASTELQIKRLTICNNCKDNKGNSNLYITGQCKNCLCFVKEKVKYNAENCPRDKW